MKKAQARDDDHDPGKQTGIVKKETKIKSNMVQEPKIGENLDGDSVDPVKTIRRRNRKRIAYLEFFAVCASSWPNGEQTFCEKSLRSGVSVSCGCKSKPER